MDKLLRNCLDTLYLPSFLNKSGIYYARGCYCSKTHCVCQHPEERQSGVSDFVKLHVQQECSALKSSTIKDCSEKSFTDQRQIYEDIRERRSKRSLSKDSRSQFVQSEDSSGRNWGDNAILDSELDFDTLYELCEFRERNSAECMSASNRLRYRRRNRNKFGGVGHKCLHKYQMNEKLQPVPRLASSRGESLCEICGGISQYLREHTVNEIIARDPHLGGKDAPIVVVEVPRKV